MKTSQKGIDLIKHYESLHDGNLTKTGLQPKMDPSEYWTEGYGHLMIYLGKPLRGGENEEIVYSISEIKTEKQAELVLSQDLEECEYMIHKLNLQLTQYQFDAIVSFSFNVGGGAFKNSTLLKMIKNELWSDNNLIRDEFLKWKYSDRIILKGLYNRRKSEAGLFINNNLIYYNV